MAYTLDRPDLLFRLLGYHEGFHLLVVAGSIAFGMVIWRWVLPMAIRRG